VIETNSNGQWTDVDLMSKNGLYTPFSLFRFFIFVIKTEILAGVDGI